MPISDFYIDKITDCIEECSTGKSFTTVVNTVTSQDIQSIYKKDGWQFNWKKEYKEPGHQIFKLLIRNDSQIQGLVSLQAMDNDRYIEMHLIETAPHNYGKAKRFLGVPGNMVAFACKLSFEKGYEGFVAFTAKTRLIEHYRKTLGAQLVMGKNRMIIFPQQALFLVNSYYKHWKHEG